MNKLKEKKYKVIVDSDPGIDDAACLIYMLFDESLDIKLISTVAGNINVDISTRNCLHFLDLFNKDIPVARGAEKPMFRIGHDAAHIHQADGLGGYIPPKKTHHKIVSNDSVEEMYKILKNGDGDIEILILGPQTNIGLLLSKHPDIIPKIPRIVFMGGSPNGIEGFPNHISFNISCDPEAFKVVLDSNIPLVMIPSNLGRNKAYLTEDYVENLKNVNDVGKLLNEMYNKYLSPTTIDNRIATNDTCAYMYIVNPKLFKTKKVDVEVDLKDFPGKTFASYNRKGNVTLAEDIDREKFLKILDEKLEKLKDIKIPKAD